MSEFSELRREKQLGKVNAVLVPFAEAKHHDQGNLQNKAFNWGYGSRA